MLNTGPNGLYHPPSLPQYSTTLCLCPSNIPLSPVHSSSATRSPYLRHTRLCTSSSSAWNSLSTGVSVTHSLGVFMAFFKHIIVRPSLPILFKFENCLFHCLLAFPIFYFFSSLYYHDIPYFSYYSYPLSACPYYNFLLFATYKASHQVFYIYIDLI